MDVEKSIARLRAIVNSIEQVISSLELMLESNGPPAAASSKMPALTSSRGRLIRRKAARSRPKRGKY